MQGAAGYRDHSLNSSQASGRQAIPSRQLSTLSARRVLNWLGVPTPPSRSKWTRPGWMASSARIADCVTGAVRLIL